MTDQSHVQIRKLINEDDINELSYDIARWIYLSASDKFNFVHGSEMKARARLERFVRSESSFFSGLNASVAFVDRWPVGTTIELEGKLVPECLRADFLDLARQADRTEREALLTRLSKLRETSMAINIDEYYLAVLTVDPAYRGLGIGRRLLLGYIQRGRQGGYKKLRLDVRSDNETALRLYESHGFKPVQVTQAEFLGISTISFLLDL